MRRPRLFVKAAAPQGQQIWFDARADGHSPDERETRENGRFAFAGELLHLRAP
jgi:hypothetical protein